MQVCLILSDPEERESWRKVVTRHWKTLSIHGWYVQTLYTLIHIHIAAGIHVNLYNRLQL